MTPEMRLKTQRYRRCPLVTPRLPPLAAFAITPSVHKIALNLTLPNRESGFSFLARNFVAQDERFSGAFGILERAAAPWAFFGCSLSLTLGGELIAHKAFGGFTYDAVSREVTASSLFD